MDIIFTITLLRGLNVEADERTVGWYQSLRRAKDTVEDNYCDIHETIWEYAIIEKLGRGLYPEVINEYWFQWQNGKYVEIPKPEGLRDLCNWAIG